MWKSHSQICPSHMFHTSRPLDRWAPVADEAPALDWRRSEALRFSYARFYRRTELRRGKGTHRRRAHSPQFNGHSLAKNSLAFEVPFTRKLGQKKSVGISRLGPITNVCESLLFLSPLILSRLQFVRKASFSPSLAACCIIILAMRTWIRSERREGFWNTACLAV